MTGFEALRQSSEIVLNDCCFLRRHEKLLIISDPSSIEIGRAFYCAAENRCQETVLIMVTPANRPGRSEFPDSIIELLRRYDVTTIFLSSSISYNQIKEIASECGIRVASFPSVTEENYIRTMRTDWRKLGVYTRKVAGRLSTARKVHLISENGTDLTVEVNGAAICIDDGRLSTSGDFVTLPAGRVSITPQEGGIEGIAVIDKMFTATDSISLQPLHLKIEAGLICGIGDHPLASELEKNFSKYKDASRSISYLGIGTHDTAVVNGRIFEDRVASGAVHLKLGKVAANGIMNTSVPLDGIIKACTIYLDGKLLFNKGLLV